MPNSLRDLQHPSLELIGITKSYGPSRVLDQIHLSVAPGEVVALMGANGAGKSTLAKIASGALSPDSGRIFLADKEVRLQSPRAARKRGVVVVHQSTNQLGAPGLSVAENLLLDGLCDGTIGALVGRREIRRRAQVIAAVTDLEIPLERDFDELGPAHRQLIAIARAVQANASVLILDEPTASLAAAEAARLFSIVDRLRTRGVGILYISHRLEDIRRLADRIVVLRNGRIVAKQAKPLDLPTAIQAMIGRDLHATASSRNNSDAETVLSLRQIRLRPSAKAFDLSIRAGEVVAVTGALGSGKSLLLGAIFGLARPVAGEMLLDDRPWRPRGPAEAIVRGVFMAGEDRWRTSLFPAVTPGGDISGTIALPHRRSWFPFGLVKENREQATANEFIRGLQIRCHSSRDTLDLLSGGNQQKVVVARWHAAACRLLLLDEPFQGIDVGARHDLISALRSKRQNSAILVATGDVEEALEVADRVAVMRDYAITGLYDLQLGESASLLHAIGTVERRETEVEVGG